MNAKEASTRLPSKTSPTVAATTTTTTATTSTYLLLSLINSWASARIAGFWSQRQHVSRMRPSPGLGTGIKRQQADRSAGKPSMTSTSIYRASPGRRDSPTLDLAGNPLRAARRTRATSPRSSRRSGVELLGATKSRFSPVTTV